MEGLIVSNVLLWVLLVAVAFVVMGLVRQIGVLHGRLAPAGALMVDKGVAVNEPAPQITASDRHGRPVNFGYAGEKSQLLFFLSPTCPICKSLLPAIKSIAREQAGSLDVVFVSDGDMDAQQALIREHKLEDATYVVGPEVGMTCDRQAAVCRTDRQGRHPARQGPGQLPRAPGQPVRSRAPQARHVAAVPQCPTPHPRPQPRP